MLVVQAEPYNASRLATVLVAVMTSSTGLTSMRGTVFCPAQATGLPRDSVVNATALVTLNKSDLAERSSPLPQRLMDDVDRGLRTVLGL